MVTGAPNATPKRGHRWGGGASIIVCLHSANHFDIGNQSIKLETTQSHQVLKMWLSGYIESLVYGKHQITPGIVYAGHWKPKSGSCLRGQNLLF